MKYTNKTPLTEITRMDILLRSKKESPSRFDKKRFYYRVKDFDTLNFEDLFENDSFVWNHRVGDYLVTVAFEGAFQNLYHRVRAWTGINRYKRISAKMLMQCISEALDEEELQVRCTCPDFKYRFAYWLSRPDVDGIYGTRQNVAPTIRNTQNNQGYVCKHILASLYGKRWVPAAAKAWYSFIQANPEVSEELIWGG